MPNHPISLPAGYAPAFAIGFSADTGELAIVENNKPLPVNLANETPILTQAAQPNAAPALEGQTSATMVAGPFVAVSGKPVIIQLAGTWQGTVELQRSVDSGATLHGLTIAGQPWARFSANACEPVWSEDEAGAELYIAISMVSGTLEYRLSQ